MSIFKECFLNLTLGFAVSLLLVTASIAATKFYLLPKDGQKIDCDYLEIKNNQAICTANSLFLSFDLAQVRNIQMISEEKSYQINKFTKNTVQRVNEVNANKISIAKGEQTTRMQAKDSAWIPGFVEQLSFDSFSEFAQSLKIQYNRNFAGNAINVILLWSGIIVIIIGNIWFLIAAFRAGVLWGLSCMLLPFVSFVFLFVHWKVASKPFLVLMLGAGVFLGAMLVPVEETHQRLKRSMPLSRVGGQKVSGNYKCSGKVYCSEMTSCAEAKFYLRNCPGTKMDGDNDGVPCEKQWCGN